MGRNAGYLGNPNLKPEGQTVNFTKEQIEEYIKCAKDPVYFIQKYIKVVSLDKGLVPFHLFDYQEDMINKIHDNRFIIAKLPRQSGKCFYNGKIRVRNKKTGEIKEIDIGEFYNSFKKSPDR
jgi:hypothetical protein